MIAVDSIEQVANALLYEGYMLYPYRMSSVKNRYRWNFGVLYPAAFAGNCGERSQSVTECLVVCQEDTTLEVKLRFLQLQEGAPVEREVCALELNAADLCHQARSTAFSVGEAPAAITVSATPVDAGLIRLRVSVSNQCAFSGDDRDAALACSLISTHLILAARNGRFISLIDPPEPYRQAASLCRCDGMWPVLAGASDAQVLSAPIILYDYPAVAPQSPGDLFDGTEIDEILSLRVRTLTDVEKGEMRAVDERTRALLERCDTLTRDELFSLHATMSPAAPPPLKKGDSVRLHPKNRADIFDIVLEGMVATVVSVELDIDGGYHVCVTVDDDPGKDLGLEGKPGHRFFFRGEEVEAL